jgi:hypothetical protein
LQKRLENIHGARAIKMSRKFVAGPHQNIENVYLGHPQNPSSLHHQKHVRRGMDALYIQSRRREGHEEEYKEVEINYHSVLCEDIQGYSTMKPHNTYKARLLNLGSNLSLTDMCCFSHCPFPCFRFSKQTYVIHVLAFLPTIPPTLPLVAEPVSSSLTKEGKRSSHLQQEFCD